MRNRQEWFNEKMAAVSPEIVSEVQLSADIIARIDVVLKQKNMTQKDLARKMGRSEAAISRWTSGFPNLTLKSIAEISTALGAEGGGAMMLREILAVGVPMCLVITAVWAIWALLREKRAAKA
jgi:transcriptional regulator with XRE-family HTH domain